jgi:hypothetical protein
MRVELNCPTDKIENFIYLFVQKTVEMLALKNVPVEIEVGLQVG